VVLRAGQSNIGVAVYDNGIPRPQTGAGSSLYWNAYIRFSANPGTLYETLQTYFRKLSVNNNGAQLVSEQNGIGPDDDSSFETDSGLVYYQSGRVFNPATSTIVTNLPIGGVVRPDVAHNRLYFVTGAGQYAAVWQLTVRALDATTYQELWAIPLPVGNGYATKLLTVGTNGLALLTDANRLFMVQTADLAQPIADVSITPTSAPATATVGATNAYTFTVLNNGPSTVSGAVFTNTLPPNVTFISLGACTYSAGNVVCNLASINSGASGTVTVNLQATNTGTVTNTARVSYAYDTTTTNNSATVQTTINLPPPLPVVSIADSYLLNGNTTSTSAPQWSSR
jgi:uncharacterized repeat protein (TIGR01451 family)